jgi:hypothetical protein
MVHGGNICPGCTARERQLQVLLAGIAADQGAKVGAALGGAIPVLGAAGAPLGAALGGYVGGEVGLVAGAQVPKARKKVSAYSKELGRQLKKLKKKHPKTAQSALMKRAHAATKKIRGKK